MSNINTTKKGDKFEKRVYELIKRLLENDEFFLNSKKSKIFWKKGYYSEARKKDIIFDISIETYLDNASTYSTLTIIECKNYTGSVPAADVEEFDSKLSQIGEHNTKGIIFTKTAFHIGGSNFAISKGIGLAIIKSDDEIDWITYRKGNSKPSKEKSIQNYSSKNESNKAFFAFANNVSFDNLPDLLIEFGIIDKYFFEPSNIKIPFISEEDIEKIINELPTDDLYENDKLISENLCEYLSNSRGVEFIFDETLGNYKEEEILGKINFNPLRIYISKELKLYKFRWRFTLAHEVGHLILHQDILKKYVSENIDIKEMLSLKGDFSSYTHKYMEIQANKFASRLLLPEIFVLKEFQKFVKDENLHKGYIYLDHQRVNQELLYHLLIRLKAKFEVSNQVAKYRLYSLGLIQNKDMKSVKEILHDI
jgi:Zn-dependent peptidase ImmA (M78 family)